MINIATERQEQLLPDEGKSADIFSRLGYDITEAVADIVDNSIDAGARNILVRFIRSDVGIHSVMIADDGSGMTAEELKEAMRFGSRSKKNETSLGKYGIGLKSASLSQADKVTVLSRQGKHFVGRRWTLGNVKKGWTCDVLRGADVKRVLAVPFGDVRIRKSGTLVIWEDLEHLKALPNHIDQTLDRTKRNLLTELGIRFHRFLESGRLRIGIDEESPFEESNGIPTYVSPLDPFGYEAAPHPDYPAKLKLKVGSTHFVVECHIWPPKSRSPNYRLGGGRVALRQGFYFYRNDRVIQAGGWNHVRADDGEPHFSLARVKVDLPSSLDSLFKLDVAKSQLDPAPAFVEALFAAQDSRGLSFQKYIEQAEKTYRRQKTKDRARFPVVPGSGISSRAQKAIASILKEAGATKPARVAFKWARLDSDEVFQIKPGKNVLYLNTRFRRELAEGGGRESPVLKVALLFLVQSEMEKTFLTKVSEDWIQRVNHSLIAALKS